MSIKGKAYIVGIYEHPTRKADGQDRSPQLHAEVRQGRDRGCRPHARTTSTAISAPATRPGSAPLSMVDYLGLKLRHMDSTDTGGSSYLLHVGHAAEAIAAGKCKVALITLAGRPRAEGMATGTAPRAPRSAARPNAPFEIPLRPGHREHVRDVRDAPHARVRHHQRAARLDQGRRLAPRAAQPARDAARRRDGRGRGQLADDRRPAAPARLLRHQRRRRRDHRGQPRDRARA